MKVLFLSHYFPPEVNAPATRTFEHCREWVRDGHDVTVVTCAPNHPRGEVYKGYRNKLFRREEVDGINVIRIWTYVTANEGFVKRTLNYISYMIMVVFIIPWLPRADVVVSTSPQFFNGLSGYFVSRLKRIPWVLEIRDLWPESILAVGAIKNKTIISVLEFLEIFSYRKADKIVPVTDSFKRYIINKGIDEKKINVIKNGVDLKFYNSHVSGASLAKTIGVKDKFVVSYIGTHGMAHHLETIFEAASKIKNKNIVFLLVGDGAKRDELVSMRNDMGLNNVIMIRQLPKEKMPSLLSISDVSLVLLKKSDLFKSVIPSKIFESMAMKCPIILGVEGEVKKIIEGAKSGVCIEPENADQLVEEIERLYIDSSYLEYLGDNGRRYVENYFDRSILAKRYEEVMFNHE